MRNETENIAPARWGRNLRVFSPSVSRVATADDFYSAYRRTYFNLYRLYDLLNRHCFQCRLRRVILSLDRNRVVTRINAYAASNACKTERNSTFHLIKFNLIQCHKLTERRFVGIMLHEMTHIEDFQSGINDDHSPRFYAKLNDAGFDEKNMRMCKDSGFDQTIAEITNRPLQITEDLQRIWNDTSRKQICKPRPGCDRSAIMYLENGTRTPCVENDFQFYLNHIGRIDGLKQ